MSDFASQNTYPKRKGKPGRIDFNIPEIDRLVEDQGIMVRVIPSVLCPNRTDLGGTNHALGCDICGGDEVVDLDEECQEVWAVIQSIKHNKDAQVQGVWDVKDALITFKKDMRLYYWWKIEVLDFSSIFNQIVERGSGNTDKLRYTPAASCDTPYYLLDKNGNKYIKDTHYRIDNRNLTWLTSAKPVSGKLYSISYPVIPTFRVLETVHENRYYYESFKSKEKRPVNLPQHAVIRWDYMAERSGNKEPI